MPKKGYKDIKEEVIIKRTGRNFDEWMRILERFNVRKNGHQAAAKYLMAVHRVNPWWSQVIVVRYEYENKLRR
jgi:hypothetical protein